MSIMTAPAVPARRALPALLERFFKKYPPTIYGAQFTGQSIPVTRFSTKDINKETALSEAESPPTLSTAPITSPGDLNASMTESTTEPPASEPTDTSQLRNPFLPWKAGRGWAGARIGLRRQAMLFKLAKKYDVEPLLPPSRKSTAFKEARILERGSRLRGTGEGQKVKGHKWERTMGALVEKRTKAMEEMPEMIRLWKQRGHGRGWKKYPK